MIQKYHNLLNEERIKQGYERTKINGKHKELRDNHKEEAKESRKGYRDLEKSKKRNLNKARNNIMKGTNLTYLLKQNSYWENVRYVIVKIKLI